MHRLRLKRLMRRETWESKHDMKSVGNKYKYRTNKHVSQHHGHTWSWGRVLGVGRPTRHVGRLYMRRRWQTGPSIGWCSTRGKNRRHKRLRLCSHLGWSRGLVLTLKLKIKKYTVTLEVNTKYRYDLMLWIFK